MDTTKMPAVAARITVLSNLICAPPFEHGLWLRASGRETDPARGAWSRLTSPPGKGAHEPDQVPDLVVGQLALPRRHRGILADRCASVFDRAEQVLVADLVHQLLDREIGDVGPEGLRLAAAVLSVTAGAIADVELLAMAQVARWRRLRRALEPRTEHNGAGKREREETAAAQDLPSWRQYGHEEGHHDALRIAMRTTNARSTRGPPASQGPA